MSENKVFMMVEKDQLLELIENAVRKGLSVKQKPKEEKQDELGEYVPQIKAMKILNRKTTWFHLKRKTGELTARKSANQWWYKRRDLENYIKNGIVSDSNY